MNAGVGLRLTVAQDVRWEVSYNWVIGLCGSRNEGLQTDIRGVILMIAGSWRWLSEQWPRRNEAPEPGRARTTRK